MSAERADSETRIVTVCPECDTTDISRRLHKPSQAGRPEADYRCNRCGHWFDDPDEREAQSSGKPREGTGARTLWEMDPDAWP